MEDEIFKNHILENMKNEERVTATKRQVRLQAQAQLRQTLNQQLESKERLSKLNKEMDKQVLSLGLQKEKEEEEHRSAFLSKLKREPGNIRKIR